MRAIQGFENLYSVTREGRIWSHRRKMWLKPYKVTKSEYLCVSLANHGIVRKILVHRAVALAYLPNPKKRPTVNHKDGNPANNRLKNLEWATYDEQTDHALKLKLINNYGERSGNAKLTNDQADALLVEWMLGTPLTQRELASKYGVSQALVSMILNGKVRSLQRSGYQS